MTCHVCGGASRFSVVAIYDDSPFVEDWMRSGIAHCRDNPAHDVGEPYLGTILARRRDIGETAWATDDSWTAAKPPERSEA